VTELGNRIEQTILARKLFRPRDRILVAVSGGLDSTVLLNVLHSMAPAHSWKLSVVHLNHQLRGRSSDADERFVRELGRRLKLRVISGKADVRRLAKKEKLSVEMAARKARHDFLAKAAVRLKTNKIALAHHADDQLELFFLRLLRGAGAEGLSGMKWRNPSPRNPRIELLRPLLDQPKAALRAHAAQAGIVFREDATNARLDFQRNRIRNELLPLLRAKYQPALDRTIARLCDVVRAEAEFVTEAAQQWLGDGKLFGLARRFAELPLAVQRRSVQLQLIEQGVAPDFDLIAELCSHAGRPIALRLGTNGQKTGILAFRDPAGLVRLQPVVGAAFKKDLTRVDLGKKGTARMGDVEISWRIVPWKGRGKPQTMRGRGCFDAAKVGSKITLRHWRPGDRFQPIGMSSAVKLQDLFTNQKVPRQRRRQLVLGVNRAGEVFWVEGMRISEKFKVTDWTNSCLQWRWSGL